MKMGSPQVTDQIRSARRPVVGAVGLPDEGVEIWRQVAGYHHGELKTFFDRLLACLLLVLLSPLLLLLVVCVRLSSSGPGIFSTLR